MEKQNRKKREKGSGKGNGKLKSEKDCKVKREVEI